MNTHLSPTRKRLNIPVFKGRPVILVPVIDKTFFKGDTRYYKMTDGRVYDADTFDRTLRVTPGKIKPRGSKGLNPNHRNVI